MKNSAQVIEISKRYVGQKERPANSGWNDAAFEQRMKEVGWKYGEAWCAYFTELVWRETFPELDDVLSKLFSASAVKTYQNFERDKSGLFIVSPRVPQIGSLVIYKHGHGPTGHAGIVDDFNTAANWTLNVEGNTNKDGGREGEIVAEKTRPIEAPFLEHGLNLVGFVSVVGTSL